MSIFPLPQFERDADPKFRDGLTDEEIYARLKPPTSIVVKFGRMKLIGEYPYRGDAKPGCGSKLVVRTFRAIEIAEMLTTTCSNSGCGKSVSRSEMLNYIDNSGGRDYPFQTNGEVLRVATVEDINRASACADKARAELGRVREIAANRKFPAKIVDLELTLDETLLLVYYLSDERIDFRDLAQELAREYQCRIEMRQVGARDEARLVADYERCGQHCCCKNFLKVLKPISMRSAKIQKATLDPLKISGRCGRLMCCLRYEDATYEELRKRLPKNKSRVGTSEGPGTVIDSKILVQLVLVRLDPPPGAMPGEYGREIAVPVEELMDPDACPAPGEVKAPDPMRGMSQRSVREKLAAERGSKLAKQDRYREKAGGPSAPAGEPNARVAPEGDATEGGVAGDADAQQTGENAGKKRKRRRKRKRRGDGTTTEPSAEEASGASGTTNTSNTSSTSTTSNRPSQSNRPPHVRATNANAGDDAGDEAESDAGNESDDTDDVTDASDASANGAAAAEGAAGTGERRKRRRRRRRRGGGGGGGGANGGNSQPPSE
jgi:cell fate regulator YaaT (PSP1 superfamily)